MPTTPPSILDPSSAPTPPLRSLEVTLLLGGQAAGVRHLPLGSSISVGPAPQDTFSLPHRDASIPVVSLGADRERVLVLVGLVGGRLEREGPGSLDLGTLWRPDGCLPLQDRDRLWVELGGGVAVRLAPSSLPPEAPPRSGSFPPLLVEPGDGVWLGVLALWSALAAVLLVLIFRHGPVEGVELAELPDRFVEILLLPDTDPEPASSGTAGRAAPPPPPLAPLLAETAAEDGGGLSWGRRALEARSALLRRIAERGEDALLLPDSGGLDGRSAEEILAELETLRLFTPGQVVDEALGGPRRAVGTQGWGDARLEGGLRTGTVGEVVLVAVAPSLPPPDPMAALWREELAALRANATPTHGTPSEVIRGTVATYKRQLQGCFDRSLKERPSLSGRLTLEVDISAGAVAHAAVVDDSLQDEALSRCLVLRARAWRFPPDVTERISLPFSFSGG